jgi:UDP-GlcNAc:undecaprenyl-phosphate GlcNAc-1-phosphate transferase
MDRVIGHDVNALAMSASIAATMAIAGTALARRTAPAVGMVSRPNPIVPQHTRSVAYLGGVGVAIGIAAAVMAMPWLRRSDGPTLPSGASGAVLVGAAAFLLLGIMDDRRAFGAATKFGLQAVIAAAVVWLGVRTPLSGVPLLDCAACWFWICMLVNAFNFLDVSDGLLASVSVCVFAAIAWAFPTVSPLAVAAAAACIGFLPFNHPPASIFLGDAGSHLLGFLAAALTITGIRDCTSPVAGWVVSALILVVPLFELCFITVARLRKGIPWWKGSPDHFALRMQSEGFTRLTVNALAAGATACAAAVGRTALTTSILAVAAAAIIVLAAAVPCWMRLNLMRGSRQD